MKCWQCRFRWNKPRRRRLVFGQSALPVSDKQQYHQKSQRAHINHYPSFSPRRRRTVPHQQRRPQEKPGSTTRQESFKIAPSLRIDRRLFYHPSPSVARIAASCCFRGTNRRCESSSSNCLRCQLDFAQPMPNNKRQNTADNRQNRLKHFRSLSTCRFDPFSPLPRTDHQNSRHGRASQPWCKISHPPSRPRSAKIPEHEPSSTIHSSDGDRYEKRQRPTFPATRSFGRRKLPNGASSISPHCLHYRNPVAHCSSQDIPVLSSYRVLGQWQAVENTFPALTVATHPKTALRLQITSDQPNSPPARPPSVAPVPIQPPQRARRPAPDRFQYLRHPDSPARRLPGGFGDRYAREPNGLISSVPSTVRSTAKTPTSAICGSPRIALIRVAWHGHNAGEQQHCSNQYSCPTHFQPSSIAQPRQQADLQPWLAA